MQPIDGAGREYAEGLTVAAPRPIDEIRLHASLPPVTTSLVAYTLRRRDSSLSSKIVGDRPERAKAGMGWNRSGL